MEEVGCRGVGGLRTRLAVGAVLEDIIEHPLQVLGRGGLRNVQVAALPPVMTS